MTPTAPSGPLCAEVAIVLEVCLLRGSTQMSWVMGCRKWFVILKTENDGLNVWLIILCLSYSWDNWNHDHRQWSASRHHNRNERHFKRKQAHSISLAPRTTPAPARGVVHQGQQQMFCRLATAAGCIFFFFTHVRICTTSFGVWACFIRLTVFKLRKLFVMAVIFSSDVSGWAALRMPDTERHQRWRWKHQLGVMAACFLRQFATPWMHSQMPGRYRVIYIYIDAISILWNVRCGFVIQSCSTFMCWAHKWRKRDEGEEQPCGYWKTLRLQS